MAELALSFVIVASHIVLPLLAGGALMVVLMVIFGAFFE